MPAVNVSATVSTKIVPEDFYRTLVVITNADASAKLHINFGAEASTSEAYISPGGNMTIGDSKCKSAINGISSSGTIVVKYSKLSNTA